MYNRNCIPFFNNKEIYFSIETIISLSDFIDLVKKFKINNVYFDFAKEMKQVKNVDYEIGVYRIELTAFLPTLGERINVLKYKSEVISEDENGWPGEEVYEERYRNIFLPLDINFHKEKIDLEFLKQNYQEELKERR